MIAFIEFAKFLLTFVRVLFGQALCHLHDDLPELSGVLLDGDLLLGVEVRLHGLAKHDLGEDGADAVRRGAAL